MEYNYAIFVGRFQPFHNAHLENIENALNFADKVIILVGSSHAARNIRNPFTFAERKEMILRAVGAALGDGATYRIIVKPIRDYLYDDNAWIAEVQGAVFDEIDQYDDDQKVCIVGAKKDKTTYYLDLFPQWNFVQTDEVPNTAATTIREKYFSYDLEYKYLDAPETVKEFLQTFRKTETYTDLAAEFAFIQKYKASFAVMPYPPTFVTTDAVVVCNGHILMVKRKMNPGKGLWALPGGFLGQDERIEDATIRELREETRIALHKNILKGCARFTKVFDAPGRSLRGRTITHATLFSLNQPNLPEVKGADDAEVAKWIPFIEFLEMEDKVYEDHFHICQNMMYLQR